MSKAKQLGDLMLNYDSTKQYMSFYNQNYSGPQVLMPAGGDLYTYSAGTSSDTASTTHVQMKAFTYSDTRGSKIYSIMFKSYISSGSYYYSWAVKNRTTGNFIPPVFYNHTSLTGSAATRTIDGVVRKCQFGLEGSTHNLSSQPMVAFDFSNESNGDTIDIVMSADVNGNGDTLTTNASQTLYLSNLTVLSGLHSGIQYGLTSVG